MVFFVSVQSFPELSFGLAVAWVSIILSCSILAFSSLYGWFVLLNNVVKDIVRPKVKMHLLGEDFEMLVMPEDVVFFIKEWPE